MKSSDWCPTKSLYDARARHCSTVARTHNSCFGYCYCTKTINFCLCYWCYNSIIYKNCLIHFLNQNFGWNGVTYRSTFYGYVAMFVSHKLHLHYFYNVTILCLFFIFWINGGFFEFIKSLRTKMLMTFKFSLIYWIILSYVKVWTSLYIYRSNLNHEIHIWRHKWMIVQNLNL